jgi:hypothetical protein
VPFPHPWLLSTMLGKNGLVVGRGYNWILGKERLVYIGEDLSWFQFALVGDTSKEVWCEVLEFQLKLMEASSNDE